MSICAVIVTYYPADEILDNIFALLDQVDELVIVDNGSGVKTKELLARFCGDPKVCLIYNEDNLGIAAALNIAVRHAQAAGYNWLATFDQDSQVTAHMIATMLNVYAGYPNKEKVVCLCPRYRDNRTGVVSGSELRSPYSDDFPYAEATVVMTSGSLIKLDIFDKADYFNEELFIDFVDIEFCLRCETQGYKILEIKDAILIHSAGFPTQHKLLWSRVAVTNHNALRRYYITRNAIYMYKVFIFKHPAWVIWHLKYLLKVMVLLVCYESDRGRKLHAFFLGILDGFLGRMGKCKYRF